MNEGAGFPAPLLPEGIDVKIEITKPGVYDEKGNEIQIGTELTVKGDSVPAWLVNKGRVIAEKPAKAAAVTNPAKGATQQKAD